MKQRWFILMSVMMMFLMITGCSDSKSNPETKVQEQTKQEVESEENKLQTDNDLAKQLEGEKGIERVMVQVVEGAQRVVNVDIVINNEQELSPDQVVEKYSPIIKEKYPDRPIDIIIAKEGKLLKQTTLK